MTLDAGLLAAGFRRDVLYPGCLSYERHSGAFAVQVVHLPADGEIWLNLAFRPAEGQPPMTYRPWSVDLGRLTEGVVLAEVVHFLRVVAPTQCAGD